MPATKKSRKILELYEAFLEGCPPHSPLPSERDIAARHGVNRETVRRALRVLMARGRIYRLPNKGTFASPVARGNTLLVVVNTIMAETHIHTLLPPLLMGFLREFAELDPSLSISVCPKDVFIREVSSLRRHWPHACGIFAFMMHDVLDRFREDLVATGLPILYCGPDMMVNRKDFSAVLYSHSDLYRRAFDLLESGGCEEFSVWAIPTWPNFTVVNQFFDRLAKERKRRIKELPLPEGPTTRILAPDHPLIPVLRRQKRRIGVFTLTEADSVRLALAAQLAGCPIPDVLQVTGIEGSHLGALSPVPISHFTIPVIKAGALCARTMVNLIGGGPQRQVYLDIPLTVRSSTLGTEKG